MLNFKIECVATITFNVKQKHSIGRVIIMKIRVINDSKGRYFYFHVVPILRNMEMDAYFELFELGVEEIKEGEIVIGERKYIEDIGSNINFIEIDDFINTSVSHSFSETEINKLLEVIRALKSKG